MMRLGVIHTTPRDLRKTLAGAEACEEEESSEVGQRQVVGTPQGDQEACQEAEEARQL